MSFHSTSDSCLSHRVFSLLLFDSLSCEHTKMGCEVGFCEKGKYQPLKERFLASFVGGSQFLSSLRKYNERMDSVKLSSITSSKSKFSRTFAKVLHRRAATGVCPVDGVHKVKLPEKFKDENKEFKDEKDEEFQTRLASEILLAEMFASISSFKASYAQLQYSQSPYDCDGIQAADKLIISELMNLSELKQHYLNRTSGPPPRPLENTILLAELHEQKNVAKTYEIMGKKVESQSMLKDSEIIYLKEKLEDCSKQNKLVEKRLNQSGQLSSLQNLNQSRLSPSHFVTVLRHTTKSIRSFVRVMIDAMKKANWNLDEAAKSIQPDVVFWREDDKCFVFESFVCGVMFDGFQIPSFSTRNESSEGKKNQRMIFFGRFLESKPMKASEYLIQKPHSAFAEFCVAKYLHLVHPQMESSFFGDVNERKLIQSGRFPESAFFASFAEMAKWVWLLHCLSFSFNPEGSIFQVRKGCRFSEVYMESVVDEELLASRETYPKVAFTVIPGFRIGKIVIQSQVYLV